MSPWRGRSCRGAALRPQYEGQMPVKLKGLGRGLDALLDKDGEGGPISERQAALRRDQLQRGRYQPRTRVDGSSLQEVAASITQERLMQPGLVRPIGGNRSETIPGQPRGLAPA